METRSEIFRRVTAPTQPYELRSLDHPGPERRIFVNAPANLGEVFASASSNETFFVHGHERYTFEGAWDNARRLARALSEEYGVNRGDRVALAARNVPEWIFGYMAATSIGAIPVALNSMWQHDELDYALRDSTPKVLISDSERLELAGLTTADLSMHTITVRSSGELTREYSDLVSRTAPLVDLPSVDSDDIACLFYTSGSTGNPKGVPLTHRNIITALMAWELDAIVHHELTASSSSTSDQKVGLLLSVPLFHVTGSLGVALVAFRSQGKVVSMHKWDPAVAIELIQRENLTNVVAPAAITGDLVREAARINVALPTLVGVGGGGAARDSTQVQEIASIFPSALPRQGWGMTETSGNGTLIYGDEYLRRPTSSGWPTAPTNLRIVDADMRDVPTNTAGELLVSGTTVFSGYWNKPEADAESFVNGWFRTGDIAYVDEDGFLFIVDRVKDLIIRGGENIGCGTVETALMAHHAVIEACAYAIPDDRLGEDVAATVCVSSPVTEDILREFVRPFLARFAVPRRIEILTQPLERTASGKILRREIRRRAIIAFGLSDQH